jgi:hypothetical protein
MGGVGQIGETQGSSAFRIPAERGSAFVARYVRSWVRSPCRTALSVGSRASVHRYFVWWTVQDVALALPCETLSVSLMHA